MAQDKKFKVKIKHLIGFAIVFSFLAAYYFPGVENNQMIQNSITFVGLLFGVIVGFFMADLYTRYQNIRENAALDSSCLSNFYFVATLLAGKKSNWLEDVRNRLNRYVRKFMPLPWDKYAETEKVYKTLGNSLKELKKPANKADEAYELLSIYTRLSDVREKLVMYGKEKLSVGDWLVTLFLGGLLLASIFYVKDTTFMSIVFTGSVSSAVLIIFIVMRDLSNLNFGENAVSIEPYERVLDDIGQPRYYKTKRRALI